MSTKILLISPPELRFQKFIKQTVYFPLGLMYLASMIRDISDVRILNCLVSDASPRNQGNMTLIGMTYKEIEKKIREFKPDIVGISVMIFPLLSGAKEISKICKKINPKIEVIFGGAYTSVRYGKFLEEGYCDYCVVGEGEKTFREFVEKYNSKSSLTGIKGIAYKNKNGILFEPRELIQNLDELPYPAYDLLDMDEYYKYKMVYNNDLIHLKEMPIISSRGCPYNCVFCAIKKHMGQRWRPHSPEYIIKHMKYLINKFGIKQFHFLDDNLSANPERFKKILKGIIPLKIRWNAPYGMRADSLSYEILKKMKDAGNTSVQIAIESGNQETLSKIIRKNTSLEKIEEMIKACKKLKIKVGAYYIIGFPGETIETMKQTIDYAVHMLKEYHVSPALYVASPIFGTELYKECEEKGYVKKNLNEKDLSSATSIDGNHLISTEDFNSKDINELIKYYQNKVKIDYNLKHPIRAARTFMHMFSKNPVLTLKRVRDTILNRKINLAKLK